MIKKNNLIIIIIKIDLKNNKNIINYNINI